MVTTLGKVLNKIKSSIPSIYMEAVFLAISVYVEIQSIMQKCSVFMFKTWALAQTQTGVFFLYLDIW